MIIKSNQCLAYALIWISFSGLLVCVCRRTRKIFDVAVSVHKNIQHRDIEVGRNLGNWILRWLDRMKPAAQIRTPPQPNSNVDKAKRRLQESSTRPKSNATQSPQKRESDRHLFSSLKHFQHRPFPTMIQPPRPNGITTQYRHYSAAASLIPPSYVRGSGFDGVIREDVLQWMLQRWPSSLFFRHSSAPLYLLN